ISIHYLNQAGFAFIQPGFFYEENMEKNDREKGGILNKCGNLEIRIAENNNRRSHRVISGYRPITGNDKRSNL
ncbi:hypothetical protein, partial [Escherichia coli]